MLEGLNQEQKAAVEHFGSPLLLLAGAGSGKTKVLTHKIGYLIINKGFKPHRILAITFTKKAAQEMAGRVEKMLAIKPRSVSTFHAFCVRVLREDITDLGRNFNNKFVIYDQTDSKKTLKDILKGFKLDPKEADDAQKTISQAKQTYKDNMLQYIASLPFPHDQYVEVADSYQRNLEQSNALDYDDLIHYTTHLFATRPEILRKWQDRYDFFMVDEFQDTNEIQYSLIKLISGKSRSNIFVVGDPFQTIYTWRGAVPENILKFGRDFEATEMRLEKNYRSARKILEVANIVIGKSDRMWADKVLTLYTDKEEEGEVEYHNAASTYDENRRIAEKIRDIASTYAYSDIAVLIRMSFLSRSLESSFMEYGIPYEIVRGLAFYERAEIKDLLSYLRLMANTRDKAAFDRMVNTPSRGIGKKALAVITENFKTDWIQALGDSKLSRTQRTNADTLIGILLKYKDSVEEKPYTVLMSLLKDLSFLEYLKAEHKEDYEERTENVSELCNVLLSVETSERPFSEFMEDSLLASDQDRISQEESVKIMTVHAAKGLEWPIVFLPALEEGIFPSEKSIMSDTALEEERRLFYVACTRAKGGLYLSSADYRMKFGRTSQMLPSRYIGETKGSYSRKREGIFR
ncbi:MAG TPA: DNA helicase UvrD [Nitrospiraceae bacterium]|jgi:DNA helicase-2/ATP-dependent DNA helicase PcrA|nr:DNA helicase UvrD [Nitrospiraceae bacterium]